MDLVIEGKVFVNNLFEDCCIGISNGKISKIKKILKGDKHIVYKNKIILPAGIDTHVHFRDPGLTKKEDFSTGSLAAAFGGISCVFDMPNTFPHTTSLNTLSEKILIAENKSYVDFGVYAGVTNSNIDQLKSFSKKCNGFKIYLGSTTHGLIFDKIYLKETLNKIAETQKPVLFHAEDKELLLKNKNIETSLIDHLRFRPSICEETSITDVIYASNGLNLKAHICHLSSVEGLEILKNRPNNISCGVTPHHMLISSEKNMGSQTFYKVNPPIRSSFDKESLFNALKNGAVDLIESDHAPHTKKEKEAEFDKAPCGVPGVETMYPLLLYLVKKEYLSFQRVVSLICFRPAELMGISKGKIEVGKDADLIVVDINKETRINSENLHSKCRWTPFEDWRAIFPSHVFVRGEKLIDEGEIHVKQGFGRFVGE
jgi:dihydroorotase